MVYKYLGWGKTNENGVAKLEYNSEGQKFDHSYTGVGAGEIDVVASLDKPIVDGSIVSEIFPVFDYFLYDSGVTGTKNPNVTIGTNVTEQVTSNGTVLTCTNGTSLATAQYTYTKVIGGDFEAYITLTTPSSILMGFYGGSDSARISISNVENRTYKFKRTGSNWIVQYYDGSEWVDLSFYNNTLGNKDCRFYMYLYSDNETDTVTFKDVKVSVESVLNIGGDSIVQTGDTINITGKFYDMGVPVKNIDLDIYKNGVKVDTVNTGSTGVASYSYEGSGVGEVNFQYKYSSFVSGTLPVLDCMWYDPLTETPLKNQWYSTNLSLNTDSDGTLLTNNSSNNLYFKPYPSSADLMLDTPFIVEFTVKSISGIAQPQIVGSGVSAGWIQDEGNGTHRLEIQADSQVHKFKSENSDTYVTLSDFNQVTLTGQSFVRVLLASNSSVKLKDFKIYPI